jgi:transposase
MSINAIAMEECKMALGRRKTVQQQDLFITAVDLPRSDGHVFYAKLNQLLEVSNRWMARICAYLRI